MGLIKSLDELPLNIPLFCYQDKHIIQKIKQFVIASIDAHNDNDRDKTIKKDHIFLGKANEFAMHNLFFKDYCSEPDLTVRDGDDGGFDTIHNEYNVKLDYKLRSRFKDYLEFEYRTLRSHFYVYNYELYIYKYQIWVSEPVIYSRKNIYDKIEKSFNPDKKLGWFVRKNNLTPIPLKDVLTRPNDFI